MCNIAKTYKPGCHPKIGFKTVIKRGNRYFSIFTGIEYKIGRVQQPDYNKPANKLEIVCDVLHRSEFFREKYKGMTAIFKELKDAKANMNGLVQRIKPRASSQRCPRCKGHTGDCDVKLVNLKMEIGGMKYVGTYNYGADHTAEVYIGSIIRSMTEV
jgi:hypothetical protein